MGAGYKQAPLFGFFCRCSFPGKNPFTKIRQSMAEQFAHDPAPGNCGFASTYSEPQTFRGTRPPNPADAVNEKFTRKALDILARSDIFLVEGSEFPSEGGEAGLIFPKTRAGLVASLS